MRHSPVTDFPGLLLPVNIPCVDTAIKTRCYQQSVSWRKFYVIYPIGMTMKSAYLRFQIPSIPQRYSTVITACRKNTRIQKSKTHNASHSVAVLASVEHFFCRSRNFLLEQNLKVHSRRHWSPPSYTPAVTCLWIKYLHNVFLKPHHYN
jgi:hypothetical protein